MSHYARKFFKKIITFGYFSKRKRCNLEKKLCFNVLLFNFKSINLLIINKIGELCKKNTNFLCILFIYDKSKY